MEDPISKEQSLSVLLIRAVAILETSIRLNSSILAELKKLPFDTISSEAWQDVSLNITQLSELHHDLSKWRSSN